MTFNLVADKIEISNFSIDDCIELETFIKEHSTLLIAS